MKILYSPTSPYSAKVRMAAHYLGLAPQSQSVQTDQDPAELVDNNPLGKIPVLITDDDAAIFDSRAIMQYLDRVSGRKLFPKGARKRTEAEVLEALADGITDCLLAIIYEKRMRPEEKLHQPWIDRQWSKVVRGLAVLEAHPPKLGKGLNGGHFAVAALLGYLALRFSGQWEEQHPKLIKWVSKFETRFPDYPYLKSQQA
jgi:glutathione S-transferase